MCAQANSSKQTMAGKMIRRRREKCKLQSIFLVLVVCDKFEKIVSSLHPLSPVTESYGYIDAIEVHTVVNLANFPSFYIKTIVYCSS